MLKITLELGNKVKGTLLLDYIVKIRVCERSLEPTPIRIMGAPTIVIVNTDMTGKENVVTL